MKRSLRNFLFWAVAKMLMTLGVLRRTIERLISQEVIIPICFHKPSKEEFEDSVKWLIKQGFQIISINELITIRENNLPLPKGAVLLTVDDGWQCNEDNIVAVAKKYDIPVTIFITTDAVENGVFWWSFVRQEKSVNSGFPSKLLLKNLPNEVRLSYIEEVQKRLQLAREALTTEQVMRIAQNSTVTIGGHTHTHPILTKCTSDQVMHELETSKDLLEKWTGMEVNSFAYPNGDYSQREMKLVQNAQYKVAFCTSPGYITKETLHEMYALPRFSFLEGASMAENMCRMVGLWQTLTAKFKTPRSFKKLALNPQSLSRYEQSRSNAEMLSTHGS